MALNSLFCADVPLSNYSLTHSRLCGHAHARVLSIPVNIPLGVTSGKGKGCAVYVTGRAGVQPIGRRLSLRPQTDPQPTSHT